MTTFIEGEVAEGEFTEGEFTMNSVHYQEICQ